MNFPIILKEEAKVLISEMKQRVTASLYYEGAITMEIRKRGELQRCLCSGFCRTTIQSNVDSRFEGMISVDKAERIQKLVNRPGPELVKLCGTDVRDCGIGKKKTKDRKR